MPLCLEAQALAHFLESGLHLPASYEPRDDPLGLRIEIGAKESLGLELFFRIADQNPAQRHHGQPRALYQSAVSETTSTVHSPLPYQLVTVMGIQAVFGSSATTKRFGRREPLSRGLPICPGLRGAAGS